MQVHAPGIKEKSLDLAVVVPSFDEGTDIVRMLASIARQKNAENIAYAVFIVVNNARDASQKVLASNAATADLIRQLQNGTIPPGISTKDYEFIDRKENDLQACQEIIQSSLKIALIDLWSEGNAPEECNVGIARDVGAKVACEYLKDDDGIIIMTDADSALDKYYVKCALTNFSGNPEVAAARGDVIFYRLRSERELRPAQDLARLHQEWRKVAYTAFNLLMYSDIGELTDPEKNTVMPGANMSFRAGAYRAAGGIPHLAGGEDIGFSLQLIKMGMSVRHTRFQTVYSHERVSDRTEAGCGHGQYIQKMHQHGNSFATSPELSLKALYFAEMLTVNIERCNALDMGEEEWKAAIEDCIVSHGGENWRLTPEQVAELWQENSRAPRLKWCALNPFLTKKIENIVEAKMPKQHFEESVSELEKLLPLHPRTKSLMKVIEFIQQHALVIESAWLEQSKQIKESHEHRINLDHLLQDMGIPADENESSNRQLGDRVRMLNICTSLLKRLTLTDIAALHLRHFYQSPDRQKNSDIDDLLQDFYDGLHKLRVMAGPYAISVYASNTLARFSHIPDGCTESVGSIKGIEEAANRHLMSESDNGNLFADLMAKKAKLQALIETELDDETRAKLNTTGLLLKIKACLKYIDHFEAVLREE